VGKKKRPAYRLVVADVRAPRDGAFIEIIGHYDPLTEPATLTINDEKARQWLSKGAQPSEAAQRLMSRHGLVEPPAHKTPRASKSKGEAPATAEAAPAKAAAQAPAEVTPAEAAPEAAPEEAPTAKAEAEAPAEETPAEAAPEAVSEEAPAAEVEAPAADDEGKAEESEKPDSKDKK
jgi:small subunit ribosomal protein S16